MKIKNKKNKTDTDRDDYLNKERERKLKDFKVGFFCALAIVGAVEAILLIILNL